MEAIHLGRDAIGVERAERFFAWLTALTIDIEAVRKLSGLDRVTTRLSDSLGPGPIEKVAKTLGTSMRTAREAGRLGVASTRLLTPAAYGTALQPHKPRHIVEAGKRAVIRHSAKACHARIPTPTAPYATTHSPQAQLREGNQAIAPIRIGPDLQVRTIVQSSRKAAGYRALEPCGLQFNRTLHVA